MFGYWITVSRTPISACFTVSKHTEQLNSPVPSLYVLNAAALTKPHAVEQLAADVGNYQSDIAVITETHCKAKHTDSVLNIPGYTLHRRDRQRRRGGGVAVYVRLIRSPISGLDLLSRRSNL